MKVSRPVKIRAIAVAAALVVTGLVSVSPATAVGTTTVFKMTGDAADYITGGGTYGFTGNTAHFLLYAAPRSIQINMNSRTTTESWSTWFVAPVGQDFVIGQTYDAVGVGFADATHGGISISGQGRGCSDDTGTFTVLDYAVDNGGNVTQFAASFEHHCFGSGAGARGSIYYNSTLTTTLPSGITATVPAAAQIGQNYAVGGTLASDGAPIGGATVSIKRTSSAGTQTHDVLTDPQGNYSLADTSAVGGPVTYLAQFAGDATHDAASAIATINVAFKTTALSITTDKNAYWYGKVAHITVHLGSTHTGRVVSVYAMRHGLGLPVPGIRVARAKVNSKGNVTVSYAMTRLTAFYATFDGDDVYGARRVGVNRNVTTKVIITMRGYSGKKGATYLYGQVDARLTVTVLPQRYGACVAIESQYLLAGNWLPESSLSCLYTDSYSQVYVYHRGHQHGYKFRVRALTSAYPDLAGAGNSGWTTVAFK